MIIRPSSRICQGKFFSCPLQSMRSDVLATDDAVQVNKVYSHMMRWCEPFNLLTVLFTPVHHAYFPLLRVRIRIYLEMQEWTVFCTRFARWAWRGSWMGSMLRTKTRTYNVLWKPWPTWNLLSGTSLIELVLCWWHYFLILLLQPATTVGINFFRLGKRRICCKVIIYAYKY